MSKRPGRVNVEVTIGNRRRLVGGGGKGHSEQGECQDKGPGWEHPWHDQGRARGQGGQAEGGEKGVRVETQQLGWSAGW